MKKSNSFNEYMVAVRFIFGDAAQIDETPKKDFQRRCFTLNERLDEALGINDSRKRRKTVDAVIEEELKGLARLSRRTQSVSVRSICTTITEAVAGALAARFTAEIGPTLPALRDAARDLEAKPDPAREKEIAIARVQALGQRLH